MKDFLFQDFKPHNILLASPLRAGHPDVVKLVDFGLSKAKPTKTYAQYTSVHISIR